MKKQLALVSVLVLAMSSVALASPKKSAPAAAPAPYHSSSGGAAYGVAGCGLGTYVFKDHQSKIQMILGATTNGTSGNQTFGISTGTSNCEIADGKWAQFSEADSFVAANYDRLQRDTAAGEGESLQALSQLMGCQSGAPLGAVAKRNYDRIFTGTTARNAPAVVANVKAVINSDTTLASACTAAI